MRLFFSILSLPYIAGIFLLADSPIVSSLARFNPYSLLHIPLYGILSVLLFFSIVPIKLKLNNPINQRVQKNQTNRFIVAGFIALGVAIADEIYQSHIPGREASVTDVFLDLSGIILTLFFIFQIMEKRAIKLKDRPE